MRVDRMKAEQGQPTRNWAAGLDTLPIWVYGMGDPWLTLTRTQTAMSIARGFGATLACAIQNLPLLPLHRTLGYKKGLSDQNNRHSKGKFCRQRHHRGMTLQKSE